MKNLLKFLVGDEVAFVSNLEYYKFYYVKDIIVNSKNIILYQLEERTEIGNFLLPGLYSIKELILVKHNNLEKQNEKVKITDRQKKRIDRKIKKRENRNPEIFTYLIGFHLNGRIKFMKIKDISFKKAWKSVKKIIPNAEFLCSDVIFERNNEQ